MSVRPHFVKYLVTTTQMVEEVCGCNGLVQPHPEGDDHRYCRYFTGLLFGMYG